MVIVTLVLCDIICHSIASHVLVYFHIIVLMICDPISLLFCTFKLFWSSIDIHLSLLPSTLVRGISIGGVLCPLPSLVYYNVTICVFMLLPSMVFHAAKAGVIALLLPMIFHAAEAGVLILLPSMVFNAAKAGVIALLLSMIFNAAKAGVLMLLPSMLFDLAEAGVITLLPLKLVYCIASASCVPILLPLLMYFIASISCVLLPPFVCCMADALGDPTLLPLIIYNVATIFAVSTSCYLVQIWQSLTDILIWTIKVSLLHANENGINKLETSNLGGYSTHLMKLNDICAFISDDTMSKCPSIELKEFCYIDYIHKNALAQYSAECYLEVMLPMNQLVQFVPIAKGRQLAKTHGIQPGARATVQHLVSLFEDHTACDICSTVTSRTHHGHPSDPDSFQNTFALQNALCSIQVWTHLGLRTVPCTSGHTSDSMLFHAHLDTPRTPCSFRTTPRRCIC
jgi:hypothetical protein